MVLTNESSTRIPPSSKGMATRQTHKCHSRSPRGSTTPVLNHTGKTSKPHRQNLKTTQAQIGPLKPHRQNLKTSQAKPQNLTGKTSKPHRPILGQNGPSKPHRQNIKTTQANPKNLTGKSQKPRRQKRQEMGGLA